MLERSRWYFQRLQRMEAREVLARLLELARASRDGFLGPPRPRVNGSDALPSWMTPAPLSDELLRIVATTNRDVWSKLRDAVMAYGRWIPIKSDLSYHQDPVTGDVAPRRFWRWLPLRGGFTSLEPRRIWEINRFHDVPQLALALRATQDRAFVDALVRRLRLWQEANPYPKGVAWASSLEAAIRMMNLWAAFFIYPSLHKHLDQKATLALVRDHLTHIRRYPSRFSSRGNHTLGELLGLLACSSLLGRPLSPFVVDSAVTEAVRLLGPWEEGFEESTAYLLFALEMALFLAVLQMKHGMPPVGKLVAAIGRAVAFLRDLTLVLGFFPLIGDNDDGDVLRPLPKPESRVRLVRDLQDVLSGRPPSSHFSKALLLNPEEWTPTEGMRQEELPKEYSVLRAWTGVAAIRGIVRRQAVGVVLWARRIGVPPLYGHGHCDALSVLLSVGGRPIVIDPGTYLYHTDTRYRAQLRSAFAHATFVLDDTDFSETVGPFLYKDSYRAWLEDVRSDGTCIVVSAAHDAYMKHGWGRARRKLEFREEARFLRVLDDYEGNDPRRIAVSYPLHPAVEARQEGTVVHAGIDGCGLEFRFPNAQGVELVKGDENQVRGWCALRFGEIVPCWHVRATGVVRRGDPFVTEVWLS